MRGADENIDRGSGLVGVGVQHGHGGAKQVVDRREAGIEAIADDALALPGLRHGEAPHLDAGAGVLETRDGGADVDARRGLLPLALGARALGGGLRLAEPGRVGEPAEQVPAQDRADGPRRRAIGERPAVELVDALDGGLRIEARLAPP